MKPPRTLQEFAERLRTHGTSLESDFADEILTLADLEADVAEPYSELCESLDNYVPQTLKSNPEKAVEWLGDRSDLLKEIEEELEKAERTGDVVDVVKELLGTLEQAEDILHAYGWTEGDFLEGLQALADRAPPLMEYDL